MWKILKWTLYFLVKMRTEGKRIHLPDQWKKNHSSITEDLEVAISNSKEYLVKISSLEGKYFCHYAFIFWFFWRFLFILCCMLYWELILQRFFAQFSLLILRTPLTFDFTHTVAVWINKSKRRACCKMQSICVRFADQSWGTYCKNFCSDCRRILHNAYGCCDVALLFCCCLQCNE